MDDIEFAKKMEKYFNQKFSLGDMGTKGWDCLTSMADFFKSCGIEFPNEFKGWTWDNYPERWEKGKGVDIFGEFLHSIGKSIDPNYMLPGDVLVFETKNAVGSGIYLGNGNFQSADSRHGVVRLPLKFFKSVLTDVRRLL